MFSPLVSILIPVYNRDKYIADCIKSALSQTYTNIEVIVVDNASTDDTSKICQAFANKDFRVKLYRNETNIGPVLNWKRCIYEAKGIYGKILFSDDLISPDFLETALPFLFDANIGFAFSSVLIGSDPVNANLKYDYFSKTGIYSTSNFIYTSLRGGDLPFSPGCAIFRTNDLKKNLLINIPSPTIYDFLDHGAGPDLLIYLLTANDYPSFGFVNEPLCFFRSHKGSISISDKKNYLSGCYLQAKIFFAEIYFDIDKLKDYYVLTWFEYCKSNNNWIMPYKFLEYFTFFKVFISSRRILKFILSRVFFKINRLIFLRFSIIRRIRKLTI